MISINQWWDALSSPHQVFWFIAIVFSVLFFIQFILSFIGMEGHNADFSGHSDIGNVDHEFSALSMRSIIAFFTFFGWTGVVVLNQHLSVWVAVTLASLAGLAAMFIVAYLMYKFSQLEQSGTLNLYHALDQEGEVYIPIPGGGIGQGKIQLKVDGRVRELDAITDGEPLKTGDLIKVVEIMDDNVLKVEEVIAHKENNNLLFS
jgi:membrane protein implicated in regulation of membrane protease activity